MMIHAAALRVTSKSSAMAGRATNTIVRASTEVTKNEPTAAKAFHL